MRLDSTAGNLGKPRDQLAAALGEIDRLSREQEKLAARCDTAQDERDYAIGERDRAVAALYPAAGDNPEIHGCLSDYVVVPRWRPLDYPKIDVETAATDEDISRMVSEIVAAWSKMGELEPFFTNVAHGDFATENIAANKEKFFRTGLETLSPIEAIASRQGIGLRTYRDCFELGCGVGRITRALAGAFDTVYGMDASASHLRVAREALAETRSRVTLRTFDGFASIDSLPQFDLFVSFAVLQHNPPPLAAQLLDKVLAKVRCRGAACFECLTYHPGYRFSVKEYLHGDRPHRGRSSGGRVRLGDALPAPAGHLRNPCTPRVLTAGGP